MKSWHRRIGAAYRDDAEESHDAFRESCEARGHRRIAMKSLFMRTQQAPRRSVRGERSRRHKSRKNARKSSGFSYASDVAAIVCSRRIGACGAAPPNVNRAIARNALRSECVIRHESYGTRRTEGRAAISGGRGHRGRLSIVSSEKLMHLHLRNIAPALLLFLVCTKVHAEDHRVTVGGSYDSGGYTYP